MQNTGSSAVNLPFGALFAAVVDLTFGPYPDGQSAVGSNGPIEANGAVSLDPGALASYGLTEFDFFPIPYATEITGAGLQTRLGTGNFALPVSATSTPIPGFQTNEPLQLIDYSQSFYINGTPELLYTYTPASVPEPSTLALAVGTLALFQSRARSKRPSRRVRTATVSE